MIILNPHRIDGVKITLDRKIFAGGEVNANISPLIDRINANVGPYADGTPYKCPLGLITIQALLYSSDDIMELLMVTDALREYDPKVMLTVEIPYFPYARQDRVCNPGEALAAKVMAKLINAQNYNNVILWDAHSDVSTALLDRCKNLTAENFIGEIVTPNTILVAPDAGAIKRVQACAKKYQLDMIRADKLRDPKTQEIKETIVYSEHVGDKDFLIVDDICDGGRTFIELAKKLRPLTNGKISLYITHGIFSYGVGVFDGIIDQVYVKNIWPNVPRGPVIFPVEV